MKPWGAFSAVLATGVALATLALRFVILDKDGAIAFQSHLGYFVVLGVLAWFCWEVVGQLRQACPWLLSHWRRYVWGVVAVVVCSIFLHLHEPHVFRVQYDEASHVAGSLMMHEERMAVMPGKAHEFFGGLAYMETFPSFRLYLFQLLLSLVHDTTGYRPENVFWLNGALTVLLLGLLYAVGRLLAGNRGGILAVLLFTSLPLLAQNVTSGGYDLLNLVLILALFLATLHYLQRPAREGLDLMLAAGVLLALARYESIVYLLVPLGAAMVKWWNEREITLTPMAVVSPLLVLPNLVANLLMVTTDVFMLAQVRQDKVDFFELAHIPGNLQQGIYYFFSFNNDSTNSLLLAVAGVISLVALWISLLVRAVRKAVVISALEWLLGATALVTVGLYVLTLANFWGTPTDHMASRFSLPLQLIFALSCVWLARDVWRNRPAIPFGLLVAVAAYIGLFTIPANAKHTVTDKMVVARSNQWFVDYAKAHDAGRTLYVAQSNLPMIINRFPAIHIKTLNKRSFMAAQSLRAKLYDEILILETFWIDAHDGSFQTNYSERLSDHIVTQVLAEQKFLPNHLARIVRFRGLRRDDGSMLSAEELPLRTHFASEAEQVRYLYHLLP